MPIPNFVAGGILPVGIYDCDLSEIAVRFVYNNQRQTVWDSFLTYLAQLVAIPEVSLVYVDGSFTTDKENFADDNEPPKDVDIVLEMTDFHTINRLFLQHPHLFIQDNVKRTYNVDLWIWTAGAPYDLREYFQYLRPEEAMNRNVAAGTRKGILRISLDNERQYGTI